MIGKESRPTYVGTILFPQNFEDNYPLCLARAPHALILIRPSQSGIQAGKRGKKKKKKNDLSPNFSMGLRIDPINMF